MSEAASPPKPPIWARQVPFVRVVVLVVCSFIATFIVGSILSIGASGMEEGRQSSQMQSAHALYVALFSYAQDHGGKYPPGKSSTEVFQQLLDGQYVSDSSIFYFPMKGKSKPEGPKLKPENVCWDVTADVPKDAPDGLPLIFATGYKIDYAHGGKAHPLSNANSDGLPIAYVSGAAMFLQTENNSVSIMRDPNFDPKGHTYQQLTPDVALP